MIIIEGRNPTIEALKGKRKIKKIIIQKGITGQKINIIINKAKNEGVQVERIAKEEINNLAKSHAHQGVIAFAEPLALFSPEEIFKCAQDKGESPFIIILDQIQDPHNFGSIIRTAYAAGAHGIIYQRTRAAGITPIVSKCSAGAIEHIRLAEVSNINYAIDELKKLGLWIAGADMTGNDLYKNSDFTSSLGLVIGSEGAGLRRLVKEKCDFLVKIPMKGDIDSLNASVAAAILMYEVVRQRR